MSKLLSREHNCHQMLDSGKSKINQKVIQFNLNVGINPRIPFFAEGIYMEEA